MGFSFIKGFIVFLMLLLVFPTFGESNETRPNRFFLQVFDKLFKSREERQAECVTNDGKCLLIHDSEEGESSNEDTTLQQCALDLCGPPKISLQSYSYFDSDVERLVQTDLIEKWEQEFQELGIEDIIKNWIDKEADSFDHFQKDFEESAISRESGFDYLKSKDYVKLAILFEKKSLLTQQTLPAERGSQPTQKLRCQKDCQKTVQEALSELFLWYKNPLPRKEREDRYSAQCFSTFVQLKQIERELQTGLSIPDVKRNFADTISKNFSKPTGEVFKDYINDGFHMGLGIPTPQDFKNIVSERSKAITPIIQELGEKRSNAKLIAHMSFEKRVLNNNSPCDWISFEGKDGFFVRSPLQQTKDKLAKAAGITLSLFSCLHPHFGTFMSSHEMGHLLSWMFLQNKLSEKSYGSYQKLRECATKRYKRLKAPNIRLFPHENDQLHTEEDTADMISYMVFTDDKAQQSCYLLSIAEDGTHYKGLSILNSHSEDTHSSSFLRVLFDAIHKRVELSSACKQVVEHYKDDIDFTPCF